MARRFNPIDTNAPQVMRDLAERLRATSERAGFNGVRDLADASNLGAATVSDALSGSRAPTWRTVSAIAKACDATPDMSWKRLQEDAVVADQKWRESTRNVEAAQPDPHTEVAGASRGVSEHSATTFYSLRPPLGDLPPRVRGRDTLVAELIAQLETEDADVQVLYGLGGSGKTTIALEVARQELLKERDVFWVSASSRESIWASTRQIAREIGVDPEEVDDAWNGIASAVDLLWHHLERTSSRWVLVFDNADDPAVLSVGGSAPGDGRSWLRRSSKGLVLVTTRVSARAVWGNISNCRRVAVLAASDGGEVLVDFAGSAGDSRSAERLAERLGGLPLALRLAGSYLARASGEAVLLQRRLRPHGRIRTFDEYASALGGVAPELLDVGAAEPFNDLAAEDVHRKLVGRTWELSIELLENQGIQHARRVMRTLSCFAATPFPAALMSGDSVDESVRHASVDEVDRAMGYLAGLSLVDAVEVPVSFSANIYAKEDELCLTVHRLVLEANAANLAEATEAERLEVWTSAAEMLRIGSSPAPESLGNSGWWMLIWPHIESALRRAPVQHEEIARIVLESGLRAYAYLNFHGGFLEQTQELAKTMQEISHILPDNDPIRLSIRHRYALSFLYDEEERDEYYSILALQRKILGNEHPETLITHHNWATALARTESPEKASTEMRFVLEGRKRQLGPLDPYTLLTRDSLAKMAASSGDKDAAEAIYNEILDDISNLTEEDRRVLPVETRHQAAHRLDDLGRYVEAETFYKSVIDDIERLGSKQSRLYADLHNCLSKNLRRQKRNVESLAEISACIETLAEFPAEDSDATDRRLEARHSRGDLLAILGRTTEAIVEFESVLNERESRPGASGSRVQSERHCLAHAYDDIGDPAQALEILDDIAFLMSDNANEGASIKVQANRCAQRIRQRLEGSEATTQP